MKEWKSMRKSELNQIVGSWTTVKDIQLEQSKTYKEYRDLLISIFDQSRIELGLESPKGNEYRFDFLFGKNLYREFNLRFNITESKAADDNFWIILSVKIIPDIVFWRWGVNAHDRFYRNNRRIWLKALWWYWHLSWQGDEFSTQKILQKNSTDEIVQLVERSGQFGYRIKLYRTIMQHYGQHCESFESGDAKLFRKVMKLNTARLAVVEPALYEGEEEGYVTELFNSLVTIR